MVIVDLDHLTPASQSVKGGVSFKIYATAFGSAFGNTFSRVVTFTGAYNTSGRFRI